MALLSQLPTTSQRPRPAALAALISLALAGLAAALFAAATPTPATGLRSAALHATAALTTILLVAAAAAKLTLRTSDPSSAWLTVRRSAAVCAWLLPLAVAWSAGSLWVVPAAIVFAILVADLVRPPDEPDEGSPAFGRPALLFSPAERQPEDAARSSASKLAAAALCSALAFGVSGAIMAAASLAALACAIVAWFLPVPKRRGFGGLVQIALAFLLATIILTPFADYLGGPAWRGTGSASEREPEAATGGSTNTPGGQFSGVVLLTQLESQRPVLEAPPSPRPYPSPPIVSSPVSILFTGEYWYYYWPMARPAEDALRKLGDPKLLIYHAVDRSSLIMQARQPLPKALPLSCCRAIEAALEIREEQSESVVVELILLDSSRKRRNRVSLGHRDLPPASRYPSTLRFTMPAAPAMQSFDEILVWFHLYDPREGKSARVAVDRFTLIP